MAFDLAVQIGVDGKDEASGGKNVTGTLECMTLRIWKALSESRRPASTTPIVMTSNRTFVYSSFSASTDYGTLYQPISSSFEDAIHTLDWEDICNLWGTIWPTGISRRTGISHDSANEAPK